MGTRPLSFIVFFGALGACWHLSTLIGSQRLNGYLNGVACERRFDSPRWLSSAALRPLSQSTNQPMGAVPLQLRTPTSTHCRRRAAIIIDWRPDCHSASGRWSCNQSVSNPINGNPSLAHWPIHGTCGWLMLLPMCIRLILPRGRGGGQVYPPSESV